MREEAGPQKKKQRSDGANKIEVTVRGEKRENGRRVLRVKKQRGEREKREMRPLSFYLPAVRDRFLKKALIHRQLQINHSGCIFQMKSCWEYPTPHESLNSDHSTSSIGPLFWTSMFSIWNKTHFGRSDILFESGGRKLRPFVTTYGFNLGL